MQMHSCARVGAVAFSATALLAMLAASPAQAAACSPGSVDGTVSLSSLSTAVPNRCGADGVLVDDRIAGEQPRGSQSAFLTHASSVSLALQKAGTLSALEECAPAHGRRASNIGAQITVKLIAFNDFHGYIKPFEGSGSNPGITHLSTRIKALKAANPLHSVVSAGDMIGVSPLTSTIFNDEPTIEAMNCIGIDLNAVSNHEFDESRTESLRMKQGGNHPSDAYSGLFVNLLDTGLRVLQ